MTAHDIPNAVDRIHFSMSLRTRLHYNSIPTQLKWAFCSIILHLRCHRIGAYMPKWYVTFLDGKNEYGPEKLSTKVQQLTWCHCKVHMLLCCKLSLVVTQDLTDNKYTISAYQHSYFCKQKLTAPPSVTMFLIDKDQIGSSQCIELAIWECCAMSKCVVQYLVYCTMVKVKVDPIL